jgi:nucleotide-binding universal stress UspA family protein
MAAKAQAVVDATTELMRKARAGAPAVEITSAVAEVEDIKSGIVEHATEEAKADAPAGGHMPRTVIFMGSRGLGAVARFWLGSSTNYVLHHCELPLVVVH